MQACGENAMIIKVTTENQLDNLSKRSMDDCFNLMNGGDYDF